VAHCKLLIRVLYVRYKSSIIIALRWCLVTIIMLRSKRID
jgi:hypothetical protein